jgi:hypothetical protein
MVDILKSTGLAMMIKPVAIERTITIRPHGNGRFRVGVEPRLDSEPEPAIYRSRTEVDGHVAGLQMARRWPVADLTNSEQAR